MNKALRIRLISKFSKLPSSEQIVIETIIHSLIAVRKMEARGSADQKIKKFSNRFNETYEVAKEVEQRSFDRWSRGEDVATIIMRNKIHWAFRQANNIKRTNPELQVDLKNALLSCDFEFNEADNNWLSIWLKKASSIEARPIDYTWETPVNDEPKRLADFAIEYLINPEQHPDRIQAKDLRWIEERLKYET